MSGVAFFGRVECPESGFLFGGTAVEIDTQGHRGGSIAGHADGFGGSATEAISIPVIIHDADDVFIGMGGALSTPCTGHIPGFSIGKGQENLPAAGDAGLAAVGHGEIGVERIVPGVEFESIGVALGLATVGNAITIAIVKVQLCFQLSVRL